MTAFEIHIFPGDPSRGEGHDGFMFSVRLEDGRYDISECAYSTVEKAASIAALRAELLIGAKPDKHGLRCQGCGATGDALDMAKNGEMGHIVPGPVPGLCGPVVAKQPEPEPELRCHTCEHFRVDPTMKSFELENQMGECVVKLGDVEFAIGCGSYCQGGSVADVTVDALFGCRSWVRQS